MKTDIVSKYDYLFKHNIENNIKNIIIYIQEEFTSFILDEQWTHITFYILLHRSHFSLC